MLPIVLNRILCSIIGHAYPAYQTYKLLKNPTLTKDLENNLKLWIVIGFVTLLENCVEPFLSWLPFYSELKLLLILYINLPQLQGYHHIYNQFILPFLQQNELLIDEQLTKVHLQANNASNNLTTQGSNILQNSLNDWLVKGHQSIQQNTGINLPFKSWFGNTNDNNRNVPNTSNTKQDLKND